MGLVAGVHGHGAVRRHRRDRRRAPLGRSGRDLAGRLKPRPLARRAADRRGSGRPPRTPHHPIRPTRPSPAAPSPTTSSPTSPRAMPPEARRSSLRRKRSRRSTTRGRSRTSSGPRTRFIRSPRSTSAKASVGPRYGR
jgi:hypothetical protein